MGVRAQFDFFLSSSSHFSIMQKDISEKPSVMMVEDIGNDDDLQKPQVKKDYSGVAEKTDPAEIALVKKLDRWIMPMLWSMYWLNDLEEDLNLTGTQYLTCVSILFVGYLLGQIPSNMFLTRTKPSYYMGCCMALWAVVSALTAVCNNFVGLLLVRFFLGVTEAPY